MGCGSSKNVVEAPAPHFLCSDSFNIGSTTPEQAVAYLRNPKSWLTLMEWSHNDDCEIVPIKEGSSFRVINKTGQWMWFTRMEESSNSDHTLIMFSLKVAAAPPEEGEGAATGTHPTNPMYSLAQQWTFTASEGHSNDNGTQVERVIDNFVGPEGVASMLIDKMLPTENTNFVAAMTGGTGVAASNTEKTNLVAPTLPVTLPKEALPEAVVPEAADETSSGEVIKGTCAKCGKPVFASQERDVDESSAYFHTNAKDCTVAQIAAAGAVVLDGDGTAAWEAEEARLTLKTLCSCACCIQSQQGATPPPLVDHAKRKVLCDLDLFVLDNSLRESTVGQTHGHLLEDKLAIVDAIASVGVKHKIIGAFSSRRQVDDELATKLRARGDDMSTTYGFTEDADTTTKSGAMLFGPDHIPAGLRKMAELGVQNPIIEIDFDDTTIAWDGAFPVAKLVQLVEFELTYARDAMGCSGGAFINVRDFPFAMMHCPERLREFVQAVAKFPDGIRPMGMMVEEPTGLFFASECGKWAQWMREVAMAGWQGAKLLTHVHKQWGFGDAAAMEMLANGCDGIWCSLAEEGAAMGHACSTVTIANLARIGNRHVTRKFNCTNLAKAAVIVTRRTTGKGPDPRQIVYGPRAVETVFDFAGIGGSAHVVDVDGDGEITEADAFNLADFFGLAKAPVRITLLADAKLVIERLRACFGDDAQFNEALAARMLQRMQDDVLNHIKEEYSSKAGLAKLSIDAGAEPTEAMITAVRKTEVSSKTEELLEKAHRCFQDAAGPEHPDSMQERTFYEAFLQPYLGCFSCDTTQVMMNSILDVNHDGEVEWREWQFWLLWAVREYDEELLNVDDLHHCVFRNALLPTTLHRANRPAADEREVLHPLTGEELHRAKLSDPFAARDLFVKALLADGADHLAESKWGTAAKSAAKQGHSEVVALLQ